MNGMREMHEQCRGVEDEEDAREDALHARSWLMAGQVGVRRAQFPVS